MGPLIQTHAFTHMHLLPRIRHRDTNGYLTRPTLTLDPVAADWTQEVGVQAVRFLNLVQEFSDIQHLPGAKKHITVWRPYQCKEYNRFKRRNQTNQQNVDTKHPTLFFFFLELQEDSVTLQCDLHRAATTLKVLTGAQGCNKIQQSAGSPGSWYSSECQLTQTMHQNPFTD